jgi:hypothetical protein
LREYVENPFWGLGLGREIYIEKENYRDLIEVRDIHNSWLALFLQVGPIAFIFMVVFVFKSIKNIFKKRGEEWLNMAILILVINYFIVALFQPYLETNMLGIFFWIILGIAGVKNLESQKIQF